MGMVMTLVADVELLFDLVDRGSEGDENNLTGLFFAANGEDGKVEMLRLVLFPLLALESPVSFLELRFLAVTLSGPGVTFRRDRVVITVCGISSCSDLSELRRVLRLCGVIIDRFERCFIVITFCGELPATLRPGVGVELVTSLNGDFSRCREGVNNSIAAMKGRLPGVED
jgi:hypothetical protein